MVDIGLTLDERVADGLYYANCVKLLLKYLENPECLKQSLSEAEVIDKAKKKQEKKEKRLAKKKAKQEKKDKIVKINEVA